MFGYPFIPGDYWKKNKTESYTNEKEKKSLFFFPLLCELVEILMKGYGSSHAFTARITFIFWFQTKALLLVVTFKTLHMQAFKAKLQISNANPLPTDSSLTS